jgi:hypothetical protein
MNKKGSVLIECLIAIVIFLIGIIPITKFTLNSLGLNSRSNEIEEAARITTTVIDYIKSDGYEEILDNEPWGTQIYDMDYDSDTNSSSVKLKKPIDKSETETTWITTDKSKYVSENEFDLEGRGIDLDDAELKISTKLANLVLVPDGTYTNPVTSKENNVMFGTNGLLTEQPIYGSVTLRYKSKKSTTADFKEYSQNFILVPMENYK